jgi:surface antigen
MRGIVAVLGLVFIAGCAVGPDTVGRYDPRLYDANGQIVATAPPPAGPPCREVTRDVTIGGETLKAVGTACRQPDGTWRFVN